MGEREKTNIECCLLVGCPLFVSLADNTHIQICIGD
jgi:hypothetical protein